MATFSWIFILMLSLVFKRYYCLHKFESLRQIRWKYTLSASARQRIMGNTVFSIFNNYWPWLSQFRLFSSVSTEKYLLKEAAGTDNEAEVAVPKKNKEDWNVKGLKEETNRQYLRTFKKITKANERLDKLNQSTSSQENQSDFTVEDLIEEIEALQKRLTAIAKLEEDLKSIRSVNDKGFDDIITRATELQINDSPPARENHQKPKKPKPTPTGPRKPYFTYLSADNIEIRVGRSAADNDELSIKPEHRDANMWWLHVAGCAGSHVVICNSDDDLPTLHRQTLIDAALLTAVNSKASQGGKVSVTYTRCRNVSKPYGAKPGLVYLSGDVATIRIDINAESNRLSRLLETKK